MPLAIIRQYSMALEQVRARELLFSFNFQRLPALTEESVQRVHGGYKEIASQATKEVGILTKEQFNAQMGAQ